MPSRLRWVPSLYSSGCSRNSKACASTKSAPNSAASSRRDDVVAGGGGEGGRAGRGGRDAGGGPREGSARELKEHDRGPRLPVALEYPSEPEPPELREADLGD